MAVMNHAEWDQAVAQWRSAIGAEHVLTGSLEPYQQNVTGLSRRVPAVVRPGCVDEVVQCVRIASERITPIYPISRGSNWGLGSKLPVRDDCAVMDLGRLDRIREVNAQGHYAVIEPGVTQGQLHDRLQSDYPGLGFNVTGSGRATSIIGNCLDRGVGYHALRVDDLSALEVVLADGRVLRTGFGHMDGSALASIYRHGIGPSLDGLFFQSNLGVVTSATFNLRPVQQAHAALIAKISRDEDLPALVDALAAMKREKVIDTVVHIGDRNRTITTLGPLVADELRALHPDKPETAIRQQAEDLVKAAGFGPWSAVAGLEGTNEWLRVTKREARRRLQHVARVDYLDDAKLLKAKRVLSVLAKLGMCRHKLSMIRAIEPLYGMTHGVPTDAAVRSVEWMAGVTERGEGTNPDSGDAGLLYCLPFVPMSGQAVGRVLALTREVFSEHGFEPYVTFNLVDTRSVECVINLAFDRTDAARTEAARRCIKTLRDACEADGFHIYRADIESMIDVVDADNPFWQTVARLKRELDPHGIIAPGRYCPLTQ